MIAVETTDRLCNDPTLEQFATAAAHQIGRNWALRFGSELSNDQIEELNLAVWEALWEPRRDRIS